MKDTEYAFCTARLRAKETELLTNDFISRLTEAKTFDEAVKMLEEKLWILSDESYLQAVRRHSEELWSLLSETVPDKKALESLFVLNDYFNIKAAVKCAVTGEDAAAFYIKPTTLDLDGLVSGIKQKSYKNIADSYARCADEAYELAVKTENGQNVDISVDRAALNALLACCKNTDNRIYSEVCSFIVDTSNIKIALRCANAGKSRDFIGASVSGCYKLSREKLVDLSSQGTEELYTYLLSEDYKEGVALYKESPAAFDKWCDDRIIEIIKDSKYIAFGFASVCAYYYAKLTEIKTVRILLTSKLSGADSTVIRERVRNLYV